MIAIRQADWTLEAPALLAIRRAVFIVEQHVPEELEVDGEDPRCHHFLALIADTEVGTARMMPDGHIGRVAVLKEHRGRGIGTALIHRMVAFAGDLGLRQVGLNGQVDAIPFYERLCFEAQGGVFLDANIPHRHMVRQIRG